MIISPTHSPKFKNKPKVESSLSFVCHSPVLNGFTKTFNSIDDSAEELNVGTDDSIPAVSIIFA